MSASLRNQLTLCLVLATDILYIVRKYAIKPKSNVEPYRKDGLGAAIKVAWPCDALRTLNLYLESGIGAQGLLAGVDSSGSEGKENGVNELHCGFIGRQRRRIGMFEKELVRCVCANKMRLASGNQAVK